MRIARDIAVFSRNHKQYLEDAVARAAAQPGARATFRAARRWSTAALAVKSGSIPIYFAVIDGPDLVAYIGELREVLLEPTPDDPDARRLLKESIEQTRGEGLWKMGKGSVRSLYSVSDVVRLAPGFPMTTLVKQADGKPISPGYTRAYCLVKRRTGN